MFFPATPKAIFDGLASEDKTMHMIAGDHYLETPDSAREEAADLIAGWLEDQR